MGEYVFWIHWDTTKWLNRLNVFMNIYVFADDGNHLPAYLPHNF